MALVYEREFWTEDETEYETEAGAKNKAETEAGAEAERGWWF